MHLLPSASMNPPPLAREPSLYYLDSKKNEIRNKLGQRVHYAQLVYT
jgi:hypothetical protein